MDRRTLLVAGASLIATGLRAAPFAALRKSINRLETELGGRIGLAVRDTGRGGAFDYRGGERFAMCSTFKAVLVGAILSRVDSGQEQLGRQIAVRQADLLDYAPFAKARVGGMASIGALCRAAITLSDNTAANLLLAESGGSAGVTRFARNLGDGVTRLDRTEPTLNEALPGDPRDTTTPLAMLGLLDRMLLGNGLTPASRLQLTEWMLDTTTGPDKLRAGLPAGWTLAHKTGSGQNGSDGDVGLLLPPGRSPILITAYTTGSKKDAAARAAAIAAIAKLVSAA